MDPLEANGYPALYRAADSASVAGQRRLLRALRVRLVGLLLAATGGGLILSLGAVEAAGWLALIGFVATLVVDWYVSATRPDVAWYEGRAAAESVKTLAWRYAVRGESFESGDGSELDKAFVERVLATLTDLDGIELGDSSATSQITSKMRDLRSACFDDRRVAYREGRIESQRSWYGVRAAGNRRASERWSVATFVAEGLGVVGGAAMAGGYVHVDAVGLLAAVVAVTTAWVQAKQYRTLSVAYGVTAQELAGVLSLMDTLVEESEWAQFVGHAEEAISREHTLWRASHGASHHQRRRGRL